MCIRDRAKVTAIDLETKTVTVADRPPIPYDVCSIDIGITSEMPQLPGFAEHATPAKPLDQFARRWTGYVDHVADQPGSFQPSIAVIGGGIGGVELSMAMRRRLETSGRTASVTVIDDATILREVGAKAQSELKRLLAEQGIALREHVAAREVTESGVILDLSLIHI